MRSNSLKIFRIRTSGSGENAVLRYFLSGYLAARLLECNHLCNFSRGYYEEQFCEINLNLGHWFRSRCCLKYFLS